MKTQHTPGPWRVHIPRRELRKFHEADGRSHGDTGIEILQELKGGSFMTVIGHKNCQPHERILTEANARLIAAAPELLEALESLTKELRANRKFNVKKDYSLMVADACATKAIAKAKGEIQ